jgi:hypothetical protein
MVKIRLSKEEKEYLIRELSERIKDTIYMNDRQQTKEAVEILLSRIQDKDVDPHEEFEIVFHYKFVINDLLQIVGRHRRRKLRN